MNQLKVRSILRRVSNRGVGGFPPHLSLNLVAKSLFIPAHHLSTTSVTTGTPATYRDAFPVATPGRRVVVTGIGVVSPFGHNTNEFWTKLMNGESAIRTVTDESITIHDLPCKVAAGISSEVFNPKDWVTPEMSALTSRFESFALAAADIALKDSQWKPASPAEEERAGVAIGSGIGCVEEVASAGRTLTASPRGSRRLSPYTLPKFLANLAAGQISIAHKLKGPNHCVSTACTTGAHSIGDAYRFIKYGDAEVMVCGGSEAGVSPLSLALFNRIHALSRNPSPEQASRPFDAHRDGFVMGEGAGVVVLEEETAARKRGAKIYAEVVGYGLSSDAHHVTTPPDDGSGAVRCMTAALRNANVAPSQVHYLNAHATSTPAGDVAECRAIEQVFGKGANHLLVSSTKGALGHMLGAAGAVEAIIAVLSIYHNQVPPTIGVSKLDPLVEGVKIVHSLGKGHDVVNAPAAGHKIKVAMSNSFGFGGSNASLLFKAYVPSVP